MRKLVIHHFSQSRFHRVDLLALFRQFLADYIGGIGPSNRNIRKSRFNLFFNVLIRNLSTGYTGTKCDQKDTFFRRLRIILVLPDRAPETIKIGYQLEPRFLSFVDKGFSEVKAVLKKMTAGSPTAEEAL